MARVSYDKQQAIRDMVHAAEVKIAEDDRAKFNKTPNGKLMEKLKKKAAKLEKQASELYQQAKMYLPSRSVQIYRNGEIMVTDEGYNRLVALEKLHQELATAMTFASSGKEYELIQEFMKALKAL